MSTATQGRAREHRVRDDLTDAGWHLIMRSAGSKGPADLCMAHPDHGVALVQVGTELKSIGPADRARFLHSANLCSATPVLATCARRGITYWKVTLGSAGTWEPWSP